MILDVKSVAFIAAIFGSSGVTYAQQEVLNDIRRDLPEVEQTDKVLIQDFLIQNMHRLTPATVNGIADLIVKDTAEKNSLLEALAKVTGKVSFVPNQPECTDIR
jgi:hypothetical protein